MLLKQTKRYSLIKAQLVLCRLFKSDIQKKADDFNVSSQIKSVAAEERRIQQQIVAQQKKELTAFLENQKKEYRLCKDKVKEVIIASR